MAELDVSADRDSIWERTQVLIELDNNQRSVGTLRAANFRGSQRSSFKNSGGTA